MNVFLISTYDMYPVGLRYIGATLEENGHYVFLCYLGRSSKSAILRIFKNIIPDVVGFTCYTSEILKVLHSARLVKQLFPRTKIVLGNIHATIFYQEILEKCPFIDFVVLGEGEIPMKELLEQLEDKKTMDDVHNVAYRTANGRIMKTRGLDRLPDLDDLSDFLKTPVSLELFHPRNRRITNPAAARSRPEAYIIASRGCPYNCDYCAESSMTHNRWRAHSPQKVIELMETLYKRYDITYFSILDPCFTFDRHRVEKICSMILRRRLNIQWALQTHPNHLDEELIKTVSKARCHTFSMGIDCLTDEKMKRYRKIEINYKRLARIISLARTLKIRVNISFMCGFKDEGLQDMLEAMRVMKILRPSDVTVNTLCLFPGSRLYSEAVDGGIVDNYYWLNGRALPFYYVFGNQNNILKIIKIRLHQVFLILMYLVFCGNIKDFIRNVIRVYLRSIRFRMVNWSSRRYGKYA